MEGSEGSKLFEKPRRRWTDNIKLDLKKQNCGAWPGFIWLRIGTSNGLF
jgi:hypothetical protein